MATQRQFASGEIIIRENDIGETAFVIEQGKVRITKKRGGRTVHLAELGPGGTIGEMSMIDDKPRSATVTAVEPTIRARGSSTPATAPTKLLRLAAPSTG